MRYKNKIIYEALQLRWDTWSDMCKFVGVGVLSNGEPEGCFGDKGQINLKIPALMCSNVSIKATDCHIQADENDYILRDDLGYFKIIKPEEFEKMYELCEDITDTDTYRRY